MVDILPSKGKKGWTKLECLKVEKGLLTYGWGQWKKILRNGKFKKRQLGMRDVENIARTMVRENVCVILQCDMYCYAIALTVHHSLSSSRLSTA